VHRDHDARRLAQQEQLIPLPISHVSGGGLKLGDPMLRFLRRQDDFNGKPVAIMGMKKELHGSSTFRC
jgi:hypothetical protein